MNYEGDKAHNRSTQVDQGWRHSNTAQKSQSTQVDQGWRHSGAAQKSQFTQVDQGWRNTMRAHSNATQVDHGWRFKVDKMADAANLIEKATANAFAELDDFKNAAGRTQRLECSDGEVFMVKRVLSTKGGESTILLCAAPDGRDVVAKVYFQQVNGNGTSIEARKHVLEYMDTEDGQLYTLAAENAGIVEIGGGSYYFEIFPYAKDGDLSRAPAMSFEQIVKLTAHLNEALHSIHKAGILHRDLKPANLYRLDDRIVIGDFGVAKLLGGGVTVHHVGTDGYSAPETLLGVSAEKAAFIYTEQCDYYSLGVTLASLYQGHFVYKDMDAGMMLVAIQKGNMPLTRTGPETDQLSNLLRGLCRYDPKYRFGYEDVCRWIENHNYTGNAGEMDGEWPKVFSILNERCSDERSLFEACTKDQEYWDEAREMLYEKYFEDFFRSFRTDLARAAKTIDETWRTQDRDKGLALFLKKLYTPGPIVWKGHTFNSLQALAEKMVVTRTPQGYAELLELNCISNWLKETTGIQVEKETIELVNQIEALAADDPALACYWFGNSFAQKRTVNICGKTVNTMEELIQAMFANAAVFYQDGGYSMLMNRDEGVTLYGFLYSFGFRDLIESSWKQAVTVDEFNRACLLFSMMDVLAGKQELDTTLIREFFCKYGPVGFAITTKELVDRENNGVYEGLDAGGKKILTDIRQFSASAEGTVDGLFRAYTPLVSMVQSLENQLSGNPFNNGVGLYENRGVLCKNLVGCFGFEIFGRLTPLGFCAKLQETAAAAQAQTV